MSNKAQWKYYRDNVVSTLKVIAKYVEEGKYDYEQKDLDDLLDRAKHDYAHYLELRDGEKEKTINKANAIEL